MLKRDDQIGWRRAVMGKLDIRNATCRLGGAHPRGPCGDNRGMNGVSQIVCSANQGAGRMLPGSVAACRANIRMIASWVGQWRMLLRAKWTGRFELIGGWRAFFFNDGGTALLAAAASAGQ
jgi:hypothetical protein